MTEDPPLVQQSDTDDLSPEDCAQIRSLMDASFGARFDEDDWQHALGGRHFFVRAAGEGIVSHASVVPRTLDTGGHRFATGYVEAVATHPRWQQKGLASRVLHEVARFIQAGFELGALSSGKADFYQKRGWMKWRGSTWCRNDDERRTRTADDDGGVFVMPVLDSPPIDLTAEITVEWRPGEVW